MWSGGEERVEAVARMRMRRLEDDGHSVVPSSISMSLRAHNT
jgi:hypothetical protein